MVHSQSGFMEAFGMGKDLSKMILEELWALFPIFLVPHDDRWKDSFNEIRQTLTGRKHSTTSTL